MPRWFLILVLVLAGTGAAAGAMLAEGVGFLSLLSASQALRVGIPQDPEGVFRFIGTADERGTSFRAAAEMAAGDILSFILPVENLSGRDLVARLKLKLPPGFTASVEGELGTGNLARTGESTWLFRVRGAGVRGGETYSFRDIHPGSATHFAIWDRGDLVLEDLPTMLSLRPSQEFPESAYRQIESSDDTRYGTWDGPAGCFYSQQLFAFKIKNPPSGGRLRIRWEGHYREKAPSSDAKLLIWNREACLWEEIAEIGGALGIEKERIFEKTFRGDLTPYIDPSSGYLYLMVYALDPPGTGAELGLFTDYVEVSIGPAALRIKIASPDDIPPGFYEIKGEIEPVRS